MPKITCSAGCDWETEWRSEVSPEMRGAHILHLIDAHGHRLWDPVKGCPGSPGQPHRFTVVVEWRWVPWPDVSRFFGRLRWVACRLQCETCGEQRTVKHG